jgi:hypothetical protein
MFAKKNRLSEMLMQIIDTGKIKHNDKKHKRPARE